MARNKEYGYDIKDGVGIIPEWEMEIKEEAFKGCMELKSIEIPQWVTKIGKSAFSGCENLTEIYCKATTPPTTPPTGYTSDPINKYPYNFLDYESSSFVSPRPIGCTIYVPMESVDAYKKAEYWSKYANYIKGYDFE